MIQPQHVQKENLNKFILKVSVNQKFTGFHNCVGHRKMLFIQNNEKKKNFLEENEMNIPTKFGSNLSSGFRED
jgi:hypothetical protein